MEAPFESEGRGVSSNFGGSVAVLAGQELPLRQWDVVHCPPRTAHAFVGGPGLE